MEWHETQQPGLACGLAPPPLTHMFVFVFFLFYLYLYMYPHSGGDHFWPTFFEFVRDSLLV